MNIDWSELAIWLITSLVAGIVYLIRKVFTNEKQIDLLKQTLDTLVNERKEHDEKIDVQLSEIRQDIKDLLKRR